MAPRKKYDKTQMAKALEAVQAGEKFSTVSKKYGVPRQTLQNKIKGKSPQDCAMGPKTYLTKDEEYLLEQWVIAMSDKHMPVTKTQLLDSVQKIITEKGIKTPFLNNRPGEKWYKLYLRRHPNVRERTAQNLSTARNNVSEKSIEKWFQEVDIYLDSKGLKDALDDPARIFNADESAFYLAPKPGKVLTKKGEKHVYSSSGDEKENLTVLVTGNAAGQLAPTMVVFDYERIPANITEKFPKDFAIGRSPTGWMVSCTFYEFITNIFYPWLQQQEHIKRPIIFFLDGHASHMTLHLSKFCSEHGIEIIALNPNSTHIMQPMDISVFRPLKAAWKKCVADYKLKNNNQNLKKSEFGPILKEALENITPEILKNGFKASGLYPFGHEHIDMTKIKTTAQKENNHEDESNKSVQLQYMEKIESDIIKKLGAAKLDHFKNLYKVSRDMVNELLSKEDESLFILWASAKQETESEARSEDQIINVTASNNSDTLIQNKVGEHLRVPENLSGQLNQTINADVSSAAAQLPDHLLDHTYQKTPDKNYVPIAESSPSLLLSSVLDASSSGPTNSQRDKSSTITHAEYFTPEPGPSSGKTSNIPMIIGGRVVPSPFKRNLFWPDDEGESKDGKKKRKMKEKLPFAVTSQAWREYHEKKDSEKKQKIVEKETKAKERELNKLRKQKLIQDKQTRKSNLKGKSLKKNEKNSDTDTDTEVKYCESDDSPYYEEEEDQDEPMNAEGNQKRPKSIGKGNYVIVRYEGEYFPGVVAAIGNDSKNKQYEISTMTFSVGKTFKWPEHTDKIWYKEADIVKTIAPPVLSNKRGFYTVKEMEEYLTFTSL